MQQFKKYFHILIIFLIVLGFSYFVIKLLNVVIGIDLNNFFIYKDNYSKSSGKIAIIKIDNKSLDELQKTDLRVLNLTKSVYIEAIEKLEKSGAKAIGLDLILTNKSEDENKFVDILKKYPNIVIGAKIGKKGNEDEDRVLPLSIYDKKYWGVIDVNLLKNVVNSFSPIFKLEKNSLEAFGIKIYRKFLQDSLEIGYIKDGYYYINPIKKIPLSQNQDVLIKFFQAPKKYPTFSLIDLINDKIPTNELSGKIVLIGEYGTLIHDAYFSPVDSTIMMPGVEFHANIIDSILQGKFLIEQSTNSKYLFLIIFTLIFTLIFYNFQLKYSIIILAIYFLFLTIFGRFLLSQKGIFIDIFSYFIYGSSAFLISYTYKFLIVDKNKRHIEHAFSHYLSKEIVDQISQNENSLKLGGEKKKITIFFSDIVGFTTISEMLGTDKIFQLLGEYLSEMTEILLKNKGTLDKYIGDAVMGFFNAPASIDNPEYMACITALEQQERLIKLNEKWKKDGFPPLNIRIGIDSGEAMVGNIGSKDRFNYTVIGDHVNLASRLEGVNKEYLTKICVSEGVYKEVKDNFIFRELDTIKVKGKTRGIKIYELVGMKNDLTINKQKLEIYEKALKLYYDGQYLEAKEIFEKNTGDLPSSKMILRCQDAINGKIIVKDGIFEMKNK